ncbi:MAG TPA: hypothetical protein VJ385_14845 [Fibrobacteria bacterium]|nr:hypothetical protein [Fibrobacteria bacterium]
MTTAFKPKTSLLFPNQWAVDSFLTKLKTATGWEYEASSDKKQVKAKPKGQPEGILIGLNKGGSLITVELNGEKLAAGSDDAWKQIFEFAGRYRC